MRHPEHLLLLQTLRRTKEPVSLWSFWGFGGGEVWQSGGRIESLVEVFQLAYQLFRLTNRKL